MSILQVTGIGDAAMLEEQSGKTWDGATPLKIGQTLYYESSVKKHSHYFKDVAKLQTVDVYRVLRLFDVVDPCIQHAVKKLLVSGGRGSKSIDQDVREAIDSLKRWQDMKAEDEVLP